MSGDSKRVARVRECARRNGLAMSRRGDVFTLRDELGHVLIKGLLEEVEAYLLAHTEQRRPGRRPGGRAAAPGEWAVMINDYLTSLTAAGQAPQTIELRRNQLRKMARDLRCAPYHVTAETLMQWFGDPRHKWSSEMRRSYGGAVSRFFGWAYKTKRLPDYLGDALPKVRQQRGVPRPAPDHAWLAALGAADARVRLMLRLAGEAGLRRAEVARVHSQDLVEGVGGAQLLVHGKGGKQRVVPLSDSLAAEVRRGAAGHTSWALATGWLFPDGFGGHLSPMWVGELVARALPEHWTMHTLRHRFASRAYRGSRNLRAVQVLLGHESIATTERYTAVNDDEVRAAAMAATLAD